MEKEIKSTFFYKSRRRNNTSRIFVGDVEGKIRKIWEERSQGDKVVDCGLQREKDN